MKKKLLLLIAFAMFLTSLSTFAQETKEKEVPLIDTRVDNMGYWKKLAKDGLVPVQAEVTPPRAVRKSSMINSRSVMMDSPDVPVSAGGDNTQSETSIFVNPNDNSKVFNSNNSSGWNGSSIGGVFHGTSFFLSDDAALSWGGSVLGTGGANSGDPAAIIGLNNRYFNGFIHSNSGQGVAYSDDEGVTWTSVLAGSPTGGTILDKNHLWIDNSPSSPHEGNIYDAWTDFNTGNDIFIVRSVDNGLSYSSPINLSAPIGGGSHDQGVNIQTGPNGEVYASWAIYDSWPSDETAIGLIKSTDGGATYGAPVRVITDIRGIRNSETSKNQRVNSFPSMAVDISGGANDGNIYIVWTNVGVPGTNTGTNRSIYMAKSTDGGSSFGTPIKVNQGPGGDGNESYFPWITADPVSGVLSVIFYDDRDVSSTQVEAWVSNSYDGGDTWEDFRVSDVAFTPLPISGLAGGYMGDYLGISARDGIVYPVWPDNRNGYIQAWVSPFETNSRPGPADLVVTLTNNVTGETNLDWNYDTSPGFLNFIVYRDGTEVGTTTNTTFDDTLPAFGLYQYTVTALYGDGESSGVNGEIQWGSPNITVTPDFLEETLLTDEMSVKVLTITNTGELDLIYDIETLITSGFTDLLAYCDASGGGGDEYISRVEFGSIDNSSPQTFYGDYTTLSADVEAGNTYPITITNGQIFAADDLGIWIDANQDEDFDDPGEQVVCTVDDGANGTYNVTIPSDALGGTTRMRIRIKYNDSDCGSSCGTTTWGEVEDYSLNVNSWLQVDTIDGIIAPGDSENINVTFDSTGLAIGDYTAEITVNSNATLDPLVLVPVTLHVVEGNILNTTATVDDSELCAGSTTTLHANPTGGTGTYTYSWTSVPVGFTSNLSDPIVSPVVNTTYTVVVDDGVDNISSFVIVDVVDVPAQANTPDGDVQLCQDAPTNSYTTDDVAGATSYTWTLDPIAAGTISGTGTTGSVNWEAAFAGTATISVTANNDCGSGATSNILDVEINELPNVTLPGFDEVCIDEPEFELTGGEPVGGDYSGVGVSGGFFDPADAGVGIHTITYAYSDAEGCENFATQNIEVNPLPTVTLAPYANVTDTTPAFELTGGIPVGGEYSGPGVSGGFFDPAVAGVGIHIITYTYVDANGCENFAMQTIEVEETLGVIDLENGINFLLYPNPNKGQLNLELNSTFVNDFEVKVVNQLGAIIFIRDINVSEASEFTFNLSGLATGVYYFLLNSDQQNYVKKIIVNN
ncbi:MAG: hypothetical protein ACI9SJ_000097 [Flavobacteriaceae bacterium]|jgi:hypothetical protein